MSIVENRVHKYYDMLLFSGAGDFNSLVCACLRQSLALTRKSLQRCMKYPRHALLKRGIWHVLCKTTCAAGYFSKKDFRCTGLMYTKTQTVNKLFIPLYLQSSQAVFTGSSTLPLLKVRAKFQRIISHPVKLSRGLKNPRYFLKHLTSTAGLCIT